MASRTDRPSTTAYAVLALLALRPWTAYELTQQAKRSFHHVWRKAESNLYAQPPKLVELGLARVETEMNGRRRRKRYSITDDGRAALRRWLTDEPEQPELVFEPALRLFFADLGTPEDATRSIDTMRAWAHEHRKAGRASVRSQLNGAAPFPDRDHISLLLGLLYKRIYQVVEEWCDLAEAELGRWNALDDPGPNARIRDLAATELVPPEERSTDAP